LSNFQPWYSPPNSPTGIDSPAPSLHIVNATGKCIGPSEADPGRALRCITSDNSILDTCFIDPSGDPGSPVLCSFDPTSTDVIELSLTQPVDTSRAPNPISPNLSPWFLVLSNGAKCNLSTGAGGVLNGQAEAYLCSNRTAVLGSVNRSAATWTVSAASENGGPVMTLSVSKAFD